MTGRPKIAAAPAGRRILVGGSAAIGSAFALGALLVALARAQDFVAPTGAGPNASALALLERSLPLPIRGTRVEVATTQWFGIPDLVTRSLAVGLAWGGARSAIGLSQTGPPDFGWSALGLAAGLAERGRGLGARAIARRDRAAQTHAARLGPGVGVEVGAGAWVEAAPRFVVWASAPQLWSAGVAPPLSRPLEMGVHLSPDEIALWWLRRSPARATDSRARHAVGLAFMNPDWTAWLEARNAPFTGGFGLSARVGMLHLSAAVESHPVLDETVQLGLALVVGGDR